MHSKRCMYESSCISVWNKLLGAEGYESGKACHWERWGKCEVWNTTTKIYFLTPNIYNEISWNEIGYLGDVFEFDSVAM